MTKLREIYEAISEMKVGDVKARNLDKLKLQVRKTPVRMLLPDFTGDQEFVAIGTLTNTTWSIRDLCLWQPRKAGTGIEQCANDMLAYIELYGAAIRTMRSPVPGSTIVGVSYQMGSVPFAGNEYWAVNIVLEIEELAQ